MSDWKLTGGNVPKTKWHGKPATHKECPKCGTVHRKKKGEPCPFCGYVEAKQ